MSGALRGIWRLFGLVFVVSLLFFVLILSNNWNRIRDTYVTEQTNMARLIQSSIQSRFIQYELFLDVLGHQLIQNENYLDKDKSKAILSQLLHKDASIAGFGLADVKGNLVVVSDNLNENKLPNLLENPNTSKTFQIALQSNQLITGRNYYMEAIGDWVVPFRKSIRNTNGEVVAVMTFGLSLSKFTDQLDKNLEMISERRIAIVRDLDRYYQILLSEEIDTQVYYSAPMPEDVFGRIVRAISIKYGLSLEEIKANPQVYVLDVTDEKQFDAVYSVIYDKRFDQWVLVDTHNHTIISEFMTTVSIYTLIFGIGVGLVFLSFRSIAIRETEKHKVRDYELNHDQLTRIFNRYHFNWWVEKALLKQKPFSLLILDLDSFKSINEIFGYSTGDQLLCEVSERLRSLPSNSNKVIRYERDEFIIVLSEVDSHKLLDIAHRVRDIVAQDYLINGYKITISASMGIVRYPIDSKDEANLIRNLKVALDNAKSGNDKVQIYQPNLYDAYNRQHKVEKHLTAALSNRDVFLAYQPQFNAKGELVGVESLARWVSKELGFVSPLEFIEVAEKSSLIFDLGRYLIDRAISDISKIDFQSNVTLSINVSVKQFMDKGFSTNLTDCLKRYDFAPERLIVEVTESLFIDDFNQVHNALLELKSLGIAVSLDDFGTGYSSLSLLKSLPIDEIKIDKSFVDDITVDNKACKMLESIISISSTYGFKVVAEGVEDESQKLLLETFGTDIYQGYLFSKPISIEELKKTFLSS